MGTGHAMADACGGNDRHGGHAGCGGGARRGLSRHAGVRKAAVHEDQDARGHRGHDRRRRGELQPCRAAARQAVGAMAEQGAGDVKGQNIELQGSWKDDTRQYEAKYSGTFVRRSAQLKGTQTWTEGGQDGDPDLLGRDQAAVEAVPAAQQEAGGSVTRRRPALPRLETGFLDQLPAVVALHLQIVREMLGRVEHRHDADVDQPLLPERRVRCRSRRSRRAASG